MYCLERLTLFEKQEDDHNIVELRLKIIILSPVPRKIVKFNPGLSQMSSKVFLPENMYFELTKYCCVFTLKKRNDNTNFTLGNAQEDKYKKWNKC